jgi:hypothetical protein
VSTTLIFFAKAWCSRLQYFYDIYVDADDPGCVYTEHDVNSYVEPKEFTDMAIVLTGRTLARVAQIRGIRPT